MITKKKLFVPLIAAFSAILLTAAIAGAYFADAGSRENKVYVGDDVIEISEDFEPPVEQQTGSNLYKKQVTVVNHGTTPCFVRVYADFSDSGTRSRSSLSNDGTHFYKAERDLTDSSTYVSSLTVTAPDWEFVPDSDTTPLAGFFYYKIPLMPEQSTSSLFKYVSTQVNDPDEMIQFDINVYAESCQVTDLHGNTYLSYRPAWEDFLSRSGSRE